MLVNRALTNVSKINNVLVNVEINIITKINNIIIIINFIFYSAFK